MPQVPAYDTPQVSLAGAPSARVSAPSFQDATGKQMQQLGEGLRHVGDVAGQLAEQARKEAMRTQLIPAQDAYAAAAQHLKLDTQVGYIHLKGEQALKRPDGASLQEEYGAQLKVVEDGLLEGLTDEESRNAFKQFVSRINLQFQQEISAHVAKEFAAYREGVELAGNEIARKVITRALTPEEVAQGEARIREGVDRLAVYRGLDANAKQVLLQKELGPAYAARIAGLIDEGNLVQAALLLGEKKDYLDDGSYAKLQAAMDAGTQLERVQAFGDKVIASGMSEGEALTLAREKFSGKEEELAVSHLKAVFAEKAHAQAQEAKAVATQGWSYLMEKGRMPPPSLLAELRQRAPEEERQMRDWLEAKRRRDADEGAPPDWEKYYGLRRMAAEEPEQFVKLDLMRSKPYLSASQFNHLVELQAGISKADAKAMESQRMVSNTLALVRGELAAVGIDLTPKEGTPQAKETAMFLSALTMQLDQAARSKGAPLTADESRRIAMSLIREGKEQGSGIFGFFQNKKRGYQIVTNPDDKATYIEANFSEIPKAIRDDIIREQGYKTDIYGNLSSRDKAEIERIYTRGRQQGRF